MMKLLFPLVLLFTVPSCELYEDIDVVNMSQVKLDQLDGNNVTLNMDVELDNPNFYSIKVKPSFLDFYIEGELVGKAHLLEKLKIKRKSVGVYNVKVELLGEKGIVAKALKYSLRKELKIRLVGKVKTSVFLITKKLKVDETKTIDATKLRPKMPFSN